MRNSVGSVLRLETCHAFLEFLGNFGPVPPSLTPHG